MDRILGRTGLSVSPISFGAFKIGRNEHTKYEHSYQLPSEEDCEKLLNDILDLGINLIDTAPAYGLSETRIGKYISHRRDQYTLSTKVGEQFTQDGSEYRFDSEAIQNSLKESLRRLKTDHVDIAFVHSDGRDIDIIESGETLETLSKLRENGIIQHIGFSGKTVEGHLQAIKSTIVDVLMIEYNPLETSQQEVIHQAGKEGVGVIVKKGLGSGKIPAQEAIPFCLEQESVGSVVVGSLNAKHISENLHIAQNYLA